MGPSVEVPQSTFGNAVRFFHCEIRVPGACAGGPASELKSTRNQGKRTMSKQFLAVGDYLINPELLTFAVVDRDSPEPALRLGFTAGAVGSASEIRLVGEEAREVLRWLRQNAVFLTRAGEFGSIDGAARRAVARDSRGVTHEPSAPFGRSWSALIGSKMNAEG